ncbi:AMP-binding protein [Ruminococcus champanellensis]|uniref:Acyl-CoA synthetases (AMP-forming)/AMP-acid ligases II n=1 Tax=Ruminococcus champanellensis (strain DSM 18848 / JCM 17042 / KCTC 15320 / 18P13) TaxID=213810 RepID=D4LCU6_RUMC1|nr:AMP-binding protein [Ruminococcus champanellensis]CBL17441.1 Acyl-CoA synthetases (AMP-forming)/AMP-acid ligases II [Ruminococcus champanellensis 18P13 = JCM 17042]
MKISFSTIACPDYSWVDIYSMAKDLGFDGIEIRGMGDDFAAYKAMPFTEANRPKTMAKLKALNIEIPCLSSGCCLKFKEKEAETIAELTEYCKLAQQINAPYIRVLADLEAAPNGEVDDAYVAEQLKKLAPIAAQYDVTLLVETNGVYSDTHRLRALLDSVNSHKIAALWDMHHPYRFAGESPEQTVANLGELIKYVHIKDSVMENGKVVYKMMGEGDLPIQKMIEALQSIQYTGYVSLEWVKLWMPNLLDAGVVFPQYAEFMRPFRRKHKHPLQDNNRKTGKYIWPKERLIDYTFPDVLDRVCEEFPTQYAFRYTELDYTRTYPEFRSDVDTFARALIAMGVRKGDHVAIWATNVPAWYITFWATTKIGAVLVTVNTAYKIHEAEYLLRQSDTHTLVMIDGYKDSDYVGIMKELCPELATCEPGKLESKKFPFLKNIITTDSRQPGCYTWDEAIKLAEQVPYSEVEARRRTIDKNDVCNMQYTSGTTGFPKGVMLTHYNVVNNGKAIGDCMDLSTADRMMIQVPMFHCFGMVLAMTASVTHGTTMSPITAFSPRKGLACINKEKITAFHGVPTMFIAMLGHPDFEKTDFSHMRTGIMAGSPCPIKTMQDVIEKMHMDEICITYGQTEASPATTMSKTTDSIEDRVNTVGGPIFGVECKIVDPETNEDLPDEVDGEFVARGYNIMKGYYKMPEATAAAIDENGWLHTGDLARRTKKGYYKITGRIKDMIIRGGENIYPKEIEDFLYTHPKVKDVQVIGVPDKQYGEEIMACIILNDGETSSEEEIKQYVLDHMAKHKVPRYVDFVTEFPMNAAGKILKYKMREAAVEKLNLQQASKIVTA